MNISEFTNVLNNPGAINYNHINELDRILAEFPYFQSARSIVLKGLYAQDSFKYNQALKTTAAYTTDRTVLFDFITSEHFQTIQKTNFEANEKVIPTSDSIEKVEISEIEFVPVVPQEPIVENTLEKSILSSIKEATQDLETVSEPLSKETLKQEDQKDNILEVKSDVEKPISFNTNETHSFQEWLQLSKIKPIDRNEENTDTKPEVKSLEAKLELIDKFIETNPKISPPKEDATPPAFTQKNEDTSYLMTETLAKVYLEQKKYSKAIQAYEILILKYPEKSSLFADRILEIKDLQQNNNK
ncbi:tetratricopeptide repeat protein [Flavobacterium sp. GCM10023249]|uniref:tetratricopeptide repeat protein n=1 Tax=unclassified Flavobacterium TaxID=196869 RepID=UPI003614ED5F